MLSKDEQLEDNHVELPPSIEELLGCNYDESPKDKIYEEHQTLWDGSIKETFEFKGMSLG